MWGLCTAAAASEGYIGHQLAHVAPKIPVCGAYGGLYPNLSRINFLGPSFFRNKFPSLGTGLKILALSSGGAKRKYDHGSAIFWRDAIPTHVLLQSDMCLAPPELSASI